MATENLQGIAANAHNRSAGALVGRVGFIFEYATDVQRCQTELQYDQSNRTIMQTPRNPRCIAEQKSPEANCSLAFGLRSYQPRSPHRQRHGGPLNQRKQVVHGGYHCSIKVISLTGGSLTDHRTSGASFVGVRAFCHGAAMTMLRRFDALCIAHHQSP